MSLCQMPPKFDRLVRQLGDRDDLREPFDALHERVLDRLADPAGEREELLGTEELVAEEDHEVLEPGPADLGDGLVDQVGREVDAGDLGPDRAGERQHLDGAVGILDLHRRSGCRDRAPGRNWPASGAG